MRRLPRSGSSSGDGRRGGTLDLWYWLRPQTATVGGRVVLVPLAKASLLTTAARRSGVARSIALGVDRTKLLAALPASFSVDTKATADPAKARTAMTRLRLAPEATVRLAVDESLAGAADLILSELQQNEVGLRIETLPIGNLVESFASLPAQNIDAILASQETVDALDELHPAELDMARAVVL